MPALGAGTITRGWPTAQLAAMPSMGFPEAYLAEARQILADAPTAELHQGQITPEADTLRWFVLPAVCLD